MFFKKRLFFNSRYRSKKNKYTFIPFFVMLSILFISIGYSAFNTAIEIDDILISVIPVADIRITDLHLSSTESNATSQYEQYTDNTIGSNIYLPNQDSSVTYVIDVKNLGNVEMGLLEITGLSSNLTYSIDELNYKIGDKICDDTNVSKCKLGASKLIYITIGYDANGYDGLNTEYTVALSFDFRKFFSITYVGFSSTSNLPTGILETQTKDITFTSYNGIPADVSITGATGLYLNPNLSLSSPTDDVFIEKKHNISYVLNGGIGAANQVTSIYYDETATLLNPTKTGESFAGWYDNPELEGTKITELSHVQSDITLYAKWVSYDYYVDDAEFDGTVNSVINTHLRLFSAENVNKNFRISFTIDEYNNDYDNASNINNSTPPTIVSSMLETGAPYPGFVFRVTKDKNVSYYSMKINDSHVTSYLQYYNLTAPIEVEIIRENGKMYARIGGRVYTKVLDYDESIDTFDTELTIGGNVNSQGNYDRIFDGKLSNVIFEFYEGNIMDNPYTYEEHRTSSSYELDGTIVFDGTNYIDTGLNLFSSENINKDFDISFILEYIGSNANQATLLNAKDESNSKYPGFVYRTSSNKMALSAKWPGQTDGSYTDTASVPKTVIITRRNGVINYSIAGAAPQPLISVPPSSFTGIFHSNLTFGASSLYDKNTGIISPMRYFNGIVSNISVELFDSQ